MNEQELKEKIKSLYEELIEEKKGFYLPGSGYRTKEPPSGLRYAVKALELLDVAKKLASIDSAKYNTLELQITINKDVESVRGYSYKYDYWYDKHGNCITNDRYNSLKDKKKKKYEQFEANRQVVSFAQEIGKGLIEALRKEHKL